MGKRRTRQQASGTAARLRPIVWGTAAGLAGILAALLLMSAAMSVGNIPQSLVQPMSFFALAAGGFAAGWTAGKMVPAGGFYAAMACGFLLYLLMLPAGIAVTGTHIGLMALIKLLLLLLTAAIGGLFGSNRRYARK